MTRQLVYADLVRALAQVVHYSINKRVVPGRESQFRAAIVGLSAVLVDRFGWRLEMGPSDAPLSRIEELLFEEVLDCLFADDREQISWPPS